MNPEADLKTAASLALTAGDAVNNHRSDVFRKNWKFELLYFYNNKRAVI